MDNVSFIEVFGGIFEYFFWVVDCVFQFEFGLVYDCVVGLYNVLCCVFRSVFEDDCMVVLLVYFDFVGKLVQVKIFIVESMSEQVSVGFDVLMQEEKDIFVGLNIVYMVKYGFLFIIVVCDIDKVGIFVVFYQWIENDMYIEFVMVCVQVECIVFY